MQATILVPIPTCTSGQPKLDLTSFDCTWIIISQSQEKEILGFSTAEIVTSTEVSQCCFLGLQIIWLIKALQKYHPSK